MMMKRLCRKGPLLLAGVIILLVVAITFLRDSKPTVNAIQFNVNATHFLTKKNNVLQEPQPIIKACENNKVKVLIIVPSAVAHQDARAAVRKSWNAHLPSSWLLVFFLGATKDPIQQDQVKAEANKYEDIIQDSRFEDTYYKLTLKTLALLQWTGKYCKNSKFLLKIDDDMYLNIPKLHHLITCIDEARGNMYSNTRSSAKPLKERNGYNVSQTCSTLKPHELIYYFVNADTNEYESYYFGGYLYQSVKVDRNKYSKWYLDSKLYHPDVLPPFLSGTAYMLSTNLIPHLLHEAQHQPLIQLEDVYISGLIGSNGLKLKLSHIEGWSRFRPQWNSMCLFKDLLTVHGLSPSELLTMTQSVRNLNPDECDTVIVYITNFFNTIISSVFPRVT